MALKRKLEADVDETVFTSTAKQPKLFPFPNTEVDDDIAMSDDTLSELPPLSIPTQLFHQRLSSTASTVSSISSDSPRNSPMYPTFELYPNDHQDQMSVDSNGYFNTSADSNMKRVGLFQPRGSAFTHHGDHCSQIPKLRMACSSGPNGQRTMWAHCEQCGAIEMVDTD
ncbi:hypothetical protein ABKN59_005299 [Abortiporus biennis]